jgi:hypothetical protein
MAKDMLQPEQIKSVGAKRYIAQVVDVDDHDRLLRVKVRVMVMHPESLSDDELPWAEYALPPGNRYDNGTFIHVEVGDYIWVDFPYDGDVRRPRMLASIHYAPNSQPEFPHEAWLGPDAVEHKRIIAPMPKDRVYFQNNVFSEFGLVMEVVPDNGSVIVTQKATGSAIEIHYAGHVTLHSEGNAYVEAAGHVYIYAKKDVYIIARQNIRGTADKEISLDAPIIKLNCR